MDKLYDISEICTLCDVTSRALRYYEEQGLIESTVIYPSQRRHYTESQLERIKQVVALRALGLSVKTVLEMSREQTSLKEAVLAHRVDLIRLIMEKHRQINMLEEVLHNIQTEPQQNCVPNIEIQCSDQQLEIAEVCLDAMLREEYGAFMSHFSDDMKILLPEAALAHSTRLAIEPLGAFVKKGIPTRAKHAPNVVIWPLQYEKTNLRMKFVFHGEEICGLWSDYAE